MNTIRSLALAGLVLIVALLLIGIQQYRLVALRAEIAVETKAKNDALDANTENQKTISTLQAEAQRNANYQADLSKRLKASEQKAEQARKDFEDLKRKSPAVRSWADQPLPDGLRSKAPASNKNKRGSK